MKATVVFANENRLGLAIQDANQLKQELLATLDRKPSEKKEESNPIEGTEAELKQASRTSDILDVEPSFSGTIAGHPRPTLLQP